MVVFSWRRHTGGLCFHDKRRDPRHGMHEQVVGLATILAASCMDFCSNKAKKWAVVGGVPMLFTAMIFVVIDRSKFQGYASAEHAPLSNWGGGSFGAVDFSKLWESPMQHWFYVVRTFFSVTINISSILLVLIDAVCLQVRDTQGVMCRMTYCGDERITTKMPSLMPATQLVSVATCGAGALSAGMFF